MEAIGYIVTVQPASEPVSATEMKLYLRIDGTTYDTMLAALITSARQLVERTTGRLFVTQDVGVKFAGYDWEDGLILPIAPVASVVSVTHTIGGDAATLSADDYTLDRYRLWPRIIPAYGASWPSADGGSVVVAVKAGEVTSTEGVGKLLIQAIVADMFEHPEANIELTLAENKTVARLLSAWRTTW